MFYMSTQNIFPTHHIQITFRINIEMLIKCKRNVDPMEFLCLSIQPKKAIMGRYIYLIFPYLHMINNFIRHIGRVTLFFPIIIKPTCIQVITWQTTQIGSYIQTILLFIITNTFHIIMRNRVFSTGCKLLKSIPFLIYTSDAAPICTKP